MTDRGLVAMAEWSAALRTARKKRRRVARWVIAVAALGCALGLTIAAAPAPWFVWNVSASAPTGLYGVGRLEGIARGDMVIARVPASWRQFAARRRYIPANVPLVKRVAALPGDCVCAVGAVLLVNGTAVAERRAVDGHGRAMPAWSGCVTLVDGAHLLLMEHADSFDGRYFGPSPGRDIIGKAHLLWRR